MTVETYNLEDTELYLYRNVPIADGMVPVWQSPQEQFENWQQYATHRSVNTLYINGSQGNIQLNVDPSVIIGCDYITFINRYFENKIYYARVTNTEVIANSVVNVDFQIDDFQTYMFDFQMRGGVVLREHLTDEDHRKALANPWRDDVAELFTDEGFSLTSAEEVTYKRPDELNVSQVHGVPYPKGVTATNLIFDDAPRESDGVDGLVTMIGQPSTLPHRLGSGIDHDGLFAMDGITKRNTYIVAEVTGDLYDYALNWIRDGDMRYFIGGGSEEVRGEIAQLISRFNDILDSGVGNMFTPSGSKLLILSFPGESGNAVQQFYGLAGRNSETNSIIQVREVPRDALENSFQLLIRQASHRDDRFTATRYDEVWKSRRGTAVSHPVAVPKYSDLFGYVNPKLERFPFRYLRLNSPNGDDKELVIEKFQNHHPVINVYGEVMAEPALHAAPAGYNGHSLDFSNRLTYEGFPVVGGESDAYYNYIRARAAAVLENDTQNAKRARDMTEMNKADANSLNSPNLLNPRDWLRGAQWIGEKAGGALGVIRSTLAGDPQQGLEDAGAPRFERMQLNQAEEILDGGMPTETFTGEEAPGGTFAVPRGLTAGMGEYTAGTSDNLINFALNRSQFEAVVVTYQREVIKAYSDFLEAYGYRSDSIKQPRVMDYIRGGVGPRFVEMDGLTFTYAQTEKVKIYGVTPGAAANIAAVFNGGARFTKGM